MYHRLGHVNKIYVKAGDRVSVGKLVATNGTGNGKWKAHCHYDIFREKQSNWMRYNIDWTKVDTLNVWENPTPYYKKVMPNFDHFGWEFLEKAIYKDGACWHPGVDLNGPGAGNADFDDPLYSPVDGVIERIYGGNLSNGDWGRVIIIKEEPMKQNIVKEIQKASKKYLRIDTGDYINKKEDEKIAKEIKKLVAEINLGAEMTTQLINEKNALIKKYDKLDKATLILAETVAELEREKGGEELFRQKLGKIILILKKIK